MHLRDEQHDRGRALPADARLRARHAGRPAAALPRPVAAGDRERDLRRRRSRSSSAGRSSGSTCPRARCRRSRSSSPSRPSRARGSAWSIAALGLRVRETATLNNIVFGVLLVFCGVNVALDDAARLDADDRAGAAADARDRGGARARRRSSALGTSRGWSAAEALVGAVYGLLGYALLRALEWQSRRRATLERHEDAVSAARVVRVGLTLPRRRTIDDGRGCSSSSPRSSCRCSSRPSPTTCSRPAASRGRSSTRRSAPASTGSGRPRCSARAARSSGSAGRGRSSCSSPRPHRSCSCSCR